MCERVCEVSQTDSSRDQSPREVVGTDGGVIAIGEVLECLTSARRRQILYYLQDHEVADVDELARWITVQEDIQAKGCTSDGHDRIATSLVHTHLPKLADTKLIEYDPRSDTIRYANPPAVLTTILRLLAQLEQEQRG